MDGEELELPAPLNDLVADGVTGPYATPRVLPVTPPATADRIPARYRRSASASIVAAGLLGLRDIIDPPEDDRPVVEQYADDDGPVRPVEVYLDPDDPSSSMVVIRDPFDDN